MGSFCIVIVGGLLCFVWFGPFLFDNFDVCVFASVVIVFGVWLVQCLVI